MARSTRRRDNGLVARVSQFANVRVSRLAQTVQSRDDAHHRRWLGEDLSEELGIAALEQYRREWDEDKKAFRANEVHDWTSHPADAFRYLAVSWRRAPVVIERTTPKQPTGSVVLEGPPVARKGTSLKV